MLAADPDAGDTHTWTLDDGKTDQTGTFYVELDSLTDVWKIAVNNQGYSCRVDFAGTQTPTSACDVSTEGECSALGANICIWVDRVSPDKHSIFLKEEYQADGYLPIPYLFLKVDPIYYLQVQPIDL